MSFAPDAERGDEGGGTGRTGESDSPVAGPLLLYDGVCALCNGVVRFVLRHDRTRSVRFTALDGDAGRSVLARHPGLAGVDSVVFVDAGRAHTRSDAVIELGRYVGWPWRALRALRVIPRPLRDWGYDLVARARYRTFGRYDACPLPPPEARARFLD